MINAKQDTKLDKIIRYETVLEYHSKVTLTPFHSIWVRMLAPRIQPVLHFLRGFKYVQKAPPREREKARARAK